jgi:hypothetical protein
MDENSPLPNQPRQRGVRNAVHASHGLGLGSNRIPFPSHGSPHVTNGVTSDGRNRL